MLKQLFRISGEMGSKSVQPLLCITIGERHAGFSVSDLQSKELSELMYYSGEPMTSDKLDEIWNTNPELTKEFYQVLVCYDHSRSCLVPSSNDITGQGNVLLDVMHGETTDNTLLLERVHDWQLWNVYSVPSLVHKWVMAKFPTSRYWQRFTMNTMNTGNVPAKGLILLDFRENDLTISAARLEQMLLVQTYQYASPDDVIYYLLRICEQFALNQEEVQLQVSGLIERESAMYRELFHYFLGISFRNADWKFTLPTDDPGHFFTSLNDLSRCAS